MIRPPTVRVRITMESKLYSGRSALGATLSYFLAGQTGEAG